jgi:hypothetical protein
MQEAEDWHQGAQLQKGFLLSAAQQTKTGDAD